jgi:hypothetical protein
MPEPDSADISKPGGWLVRASLVGGSPLTFYVFELDNNKAAELARSAIPATLGEAIEAVRLLNIHELTDYGMKPGDVKQLSNALRRDVRSWRELRHDDTCRDGKQNPDTYNHQEKKPVSHRG